MEVSNEVVERFMGKVKFFEKGQCWEWSGYIRKDGYANFYIKDKVYLAHRISYIMANVKVLDNKNVCHSCDNPRCVNPEHLWAGTQKDNMRDCSLKGRIVNKESQKTSCVRGHLLSGYNLSRRKGRGGYVFRKCKACDRIRAKKYRLKKNGH